MYVQKHGMVEMWLGYTVFPRNLAAPRNPAALKLSPHISASSSQLINVAPEMSPYGTGSTTIRMRTRIIHAYKWLIDQLKR